MVHSFTSPVSRRLLDTSEALGRSPQTLAVKAVDKIIRGQDEADVTVGWSGRLDKYLASYVIESTDLSQTNGARLRTTLILGNVSPLDSSSRMTMDKSLLHLWRRRFILKYRSGPTPSLSILCLESRWRPACRGVFGGQRECFSKEEMEASPG
jgi:hypothetical protein